MDNTGQTLGDQEASENACATAALEYSGDASSASGFSSTDARSICVDPPGPKLRCQQQHADTPRPTSLHTESPRSGSAPTLRPPVGMVAAVAFGLTAAVLYTVANIALRHCVGVDPFLVSAVKAVPTVVVLGPFLAWMLYRGETIATSGAMVPRFIVVSIIAQFVGNAAFQIALGVIGLAASVPITLGVMIIGGAVLGRIMLHEPVRLRTIAAMVTLISAVVVLSLPGASKAPVQSTVDLPLWVGALCAAASGAAYALFGVALRQAMTGGLSAPATMFLSGFVGTVALSSVTFFRVSTESFGSISTVDWVAMVSAGVFNFIAFVALSLSLKSLPVTAVNLINATQVGMAAVAGVILFTEPVTWSLIVGIALTFAGLMILARRRPTRESAW